MRKYFPVLLLLAGLSLLLWPSLLKRQSCQSQHRALERYRAAVARLDTEVCASLLAAAEAGNDPSLLVVEDSGIIGCVSIPTLQITLPIYAGTDEASLAKGAGLLEGSSLPLGASGHHTVLSAHRGLPHAKLFTDLDKMELGDTFILTVLDRTLTYQVDQIKVVRPDEIDDVQIADGEDLCTLLTCTPYGINSHRLLVRGTRIENAAPVLYVTSNAYRIDSLVATPVVAAPILLILLIGLMVKYRDKGSKPLISKEEEEWLSEEWG